MVQRTGVRDSHFTVQVEALVAAMATEKSPCCPETWFRVMCDNDARNDDTRSPVGWWIDSPTRFASETRLGGPEAVLTAAFAEMSTPSSNIGPSLIWKSKEYRPLRATRDRGPCWASRTWPPPPPGTQGI